MREYSIIGMVIMKIMRYMPYPSRLMKRSWLVDRIIGLINIIKIVCCWHGRWITWLSSCGGRHARLYGRGFTGWVVFGGWFMVFCYGWRWDMWGRRIEISSGASEEWTMSICGNMEFGDWWEHFVFPKYNMSRRTKSFRNEILISVSFMFYLIAQETIETGMRFKFWMFMKLK